MLYVAGALTCAALLAVTSAAEPLAPLPQLQTDPRKVELGYRLFHDPRLSRDNSVACVSCHDFARGGADPRAFSIGVGGAMTAVNSPSIFNVAFNFRQMWNGGLRTLEEQIDRRSSIPPPSARHGKRCSANSTGTRHRVGPR